MKILKNYMKNYKKNFHQESFVFRFHCLFHITRTKHLLFLCFLSDPLKWGN